LISLALKIDWERHERETIDAPTVDITLARLTKNGNVYKPLPKKALR
jgi:hypothetical protein